MPQSRVTGASSNLNFQSPPLTLAWPGGHAAGDFAFLFAPYYENFEDAVPGVTGFTALIASTVYGGATNVESRVVGWYRELDGSEAGNITLTRAGDEFYLTLILDIYRGNGVLTYAPGSLVIGTAGNGTSVTLPAVSGVAGQLQLGGIALGDPSTAPASTADMTKGQAGLQNTNTGYVYYKLDLTGAIAAQTVSPLGTARDHIGFSFLVNDAGSDPGPGPSGDVRFPWPIYQIGRRSMAGAVPSGFRPPMSGATTEGEEEPPPEGDTPPDADTIVLDDFSSARLNGDIWAGGGTTPLWYPNGGYDTATVSGNVLHAGLSTPVGGVAGQHQIWFRCNDDIGGASWKFLRTAIEAGTFVNNQTNRLRFHIKAPAGYDGGTPSSIGFSNCQFGTYLHNHDDDDGAGMAGSDDDGMHFYHFLNLPGGVWVEVIIDGFPDHKRGFSGSAEHGNWDFPEVPGHTYFAQMTAFYIDYLAACSASDETLIKNLTMFSDLGYDEATYRQVRSPQYWYTPGDTTIHCGWNRRKDQPNHVYTVRLAHHPFASFAGGNLVGSFNAPDTADYNSVFTEFSDAALAGHTWAWVAVQPAGAASFRQWAINLTLN
jgi:hypothetical protein